MVGEWSVKYATQQLLQVSVSGARASDMHQLGCVLHRALHHFGRNVVTDLWERILCDFAEGAKMATTVWRMYGAIMALLWRCYPIEMVQVGVALEHSGSGGFFPWSMPWSK